MLVQSSILPEEPSGLSLVSVNNLGDIAYLAEVSGVEGMYVREAGGEVYNLANVGDEIGGRPLTGFADQSHHSLFQMLLAAMKALRATSPLL